MTLVSRISDAPAISDDPAILVSYISDAPAISDRLLRWRDRHSRGQAHSSLEYTTGADAKQPLGSDDHISDDKIRSVGAHRRQHPDDSISDGWAPRRPQRAVARPLKAYPLIVLRGP